MTETQEPRNRIDRFDAVTSRYSGPTMLLVMGPLWILAGALGLVSTGKPWIWLVVAFGIAMFVTGVAWLRSRRRGVPDGFYGSQAYPPSRAKR